MSYVSQRGVGARPHLSDFVNQTLMWPGVCLYGRHPRRFGADDRAGTLPSHDRGLSGCIEECYHRAWPWAAVPKWQLIVSEGPKSGALVVEVVLKGWSVGASMRA